MVTECSVTQDKVGGDKEGNKVLDREINRQLGKGTQIEGDSFFLFVVVFFFHDLVGFIPGL